MADAKTQEIEGSAGRGRRRSAFDRDWTKGSTVRNLWSLSWPMMITVSLRTVGPTIDLIWVGRLGIGPVAGVGIASGVVTLVMLGIWGINTGMRAMISRFIGAGDAEGANHVAWQAFAISAVYSIVLTAVGILFSEQILALFGVEAGVIAEGAVYLRIMLLGTVAMSFHQMTEGIMQASGDAMTPMRISIIYRLFHVALCPFLIFGWWIFPRLGVSGVAIINVVSQSLGMALGLLVLFTGRSRLRLTLSNFRPDLDITWRIVRVGIPASIMMVQRILGRLVFVRLMAPFGTLAVAGHTIVERVELFVTMPGFGLGTAASVLVGQNLGAQQPERAQRSSWLAVGFAEGTMVIFSIVMLLWPESVVRIFSPDPGLVKVGSDFLKIAIVGYLVISFDAVLQNCLCGAGDTLPPMLFTLLSMWIIPVPLALILPRVTNLGMFGVRWAIVAGIFTGALAYIMYFRLGRWKRKKV